MCLFSAPCLSNSAVSLLPSAIVGLSFFLELQRFIHFFALQHCFISDFSTTSSGPSMLYILSKSIIDHPRATPAKFPYPVVSVNAVRFAVGIKNCLLVRISSFTAQLSDRPVGQFPLDWDSEGLHPMIPYHYPLALQPMPN